MTTLLQRISEKKEKLDTLRPLPPELIKNLEEWFRVEQTYHSNALEGNTITLQETALVIEKGLTVSGKSLREHLEIINYSLALDFVQQLVDKKPFDITLDDIFDIHRLVLRTVDDKNAGKLRMVRVKISGSAILLPDPLQLFDLMNNFVEWLQAETVSADQHPVKIAADAHLKLVTIHPFIDGNGRTARLLMNVILMEYGYPPAIIHVQDRLAYISSLEQAQMYGILDNYYQVIGEAVERSLDVYIKSDARN